MNEITFVVEPESEGGYSARAEGHAIFTQGDSWEELEENVREAVRCHFDVAERPRAFRLHPLL